MTDRRAWMRAALGGAVALVLRPRAARAQPKMTKKQAEYQDDPKGIMMCGTCTLFIPPAGCKVVDGDVAVTGWCDAFDLADWLSSFRGRALSVVIARESGRSSRHCRTCQTQLAPSRRPVITGCPAFAGHDD